MLFRSLALVKELMADSSSIEEFTASEKAKAAGLFCKDGELFLQFNFCPCPMLAEVEKLESYTSVSYTHLDVYKRQILVLV